MIIYLILFMVLLSDVLRRKDLLDGNFCLKCLVHNE